MRYVQAGAMAVGLGLYVVIDFRFFGDWSYNDLPSFALIAVLWNVVLLVVTIIVIVDSVRKVRAGETQVLATDVFVVKLVAVPYFVVSFITTAFMVLGGWLTFIFGGVLLAVPGLILIGLSYLATLSTSVYGWASIVRLRREHLIGTGLAVLYTILLALFTTDIAAGIMLFGHSRRRPAAALFGIFVGSGAFLVIAGLAYGALADESFVPGLDWINPISVAGVVLILATVVFVRVRRVQLRRREGAVSVS